MQPNRISRRNKAHADELGTWFEEASMNGNGSSNRHTIASVAACLMAACLGPACGPGGANVAGKTETAVGAGRADAMCNISDEINSLVVHWSADERTHLASAMEDGPVIVRVDQCDMTILFDCKTSGGAYAYKSVPAQPRHETYKDEAQLYARMPFAAARLASHVAGSTYLDLHMTMVGQYTIDRASAAHSLLTGYCTNATHVIAGISVGAFEIKAVDAASAGDQVSPVGATVGGGVTSNSAWSSSDGDAQACRKGESENNPLEQCRSPIGLWLVPLSEHGSTAVVAGTPTRQTISDSTAVVPPQPSVPPSSTAGATKREEGQPDTPPTPPPSDTEQSGTSKDRAAIAVSAGAAHTCLVSRSGGAECWGDNGAGELGDGTYVNRYVPTPVVGLQAGVSAIATGMSHTCALQSTGAVVCWGRNVRGELGDGTYTNRRVPAPVTGLTSGVLAITGGKSHTCALNSTGAVFCWGYNGSGRLGDGTTMYRNVPTPVTGLHSGVSAIAAGGNHTCALNSKGAVVCWGQNSPGQLGDGTNVDRHAPTPVAGLTSGVSAIAAGGSHACALKSTGAVVCWGANWGGQIGDGTTENPHTPTPVVSLMSGVSAIAAGENHTCALKSTGAVVCWGDNDTGRLGDGTQGNRRVPTRVAGLTSGVSAIAAGISHTCALKSTGAVVCWGNNDDGQLGDGTTETRLVPTPVVGYP